MIRLLKTLVLLNYSIGSVQSGHWICSILTDYEEPDGSKVWATINDTYPITKADEYDVRLSTLFLYKKSA